MNSAATGGMAVLPPRWYKLRAVGRQMDYVRSEHLYNIVPAGRRSGKSERAKRKLARRSLFELERILHHEPPRFFAAAPTRDQAKRIFWDDLKRLTQPWWARPPAETELTITLVTGAQIVVVGMDKPERIEGSPWDGGILDEYANMKATAWTSNVLPALADRNGWCDLIGVPEGRNHYYDLWVAAQAEMLEKGDESEWGAYTWPSSDVLPPAKIEAARRNLDSLTFEQEFEASFVNFAGRAYHAFSDANKARLRHLYQSKQTLIVCLDFNVEPGVAAIAQELPLPVGHVGTAIIGEVHIDNNSTTERVCRKILTDWGNHLGRVEVYGDQTGGARGTAKVMGSDWDLAKSWLGKGGDGLQGFGSRVSFHVKPRNPSERARVNAVNTRCKAANGRIHLMVDPTHAPHVVKDLEGVTLVKGGSGEIDKDKDPKLTHVSDALGYYIDFRFPVAEVLEWGTSAFTIGG